MCRRVTGKSWCPLKDERTILLTRCLRLEARLHKLQRERKALRELVKRYQRYVPKEARETILNQTIQQVAEPHQPQ